MLRLVLFASLAACGSSPAPAPVTPAAPQADCGAAVAATGRFVVLAAEADRVKAVVATRCAEDHWTAAATSCIGGAANLEAGHACIREHLTVAQNERLMAELRPAEPPVVDEPPPTGSQATIAEDNYALGLRLYAKQQYLDAIPKFRDAVARVPDPRYFLGLCRSLYKADRFAEALTACSAGKNENPPPDVAQTLDTMIATIKDAAKK